MWFEDESRFGQQGALWRVWARKGTRPERVRQTEYQYVHLFAAVEPATGRSAALVSPVANTPAMNVFLAELSRIVGADHAVVVLDGAGWHGSKDLTVPENLTLLPLPPYSPDLNPIERLWLWLKSHYLVNRVYQTWEEVREAACQAWTCLTADRVRSLCTPPASLGQL